MCTPRRPRTPTALTPAADHLQIEEGGASRGSTVDSLNVSVATGILLHRLLTAQQPAAGGSGSAASGAGADAAPVAAAAEE